MKLNNYPLSRKENIVMQDAGKEVLLYDLNDNKAYCLNETSALVWELCDGNSSVADINQKISKKLKQSTSEELVWLALDQLKNEKLLTNHADIKVDFNGLSRREAIKKVGFASLVALPVIMAITSPIAAATGSVCGGNSGQFCECEAPIFGANNCNGLNLGDPVGGSNNCTPILGGINCPQVGGGFVTPCSCNGPFVCLGAGIRRGLCS